MARQYCVKGPQGRKPAGWLYNILNMAATSAVVIYRSIMKSKVSTNTFNTKLAEELREEYIKTLPVRISPTEESDDDDDELLEVATTRRKCQILKTCKKNKTTF
jgi:hypothetical protein